MSIPSSQNGDLYNSVVSPGQVMHPGLDVQSATYVDVNPQYDPNTSPANLLVDIYAVLYGSVANLITCPPGGRARIFQEDYFCRLMQLLQEPFDGITAQLVSMAVNTAIQTWEPRLKNVSVNVQTVNNPAGYLIGVQGSVAGLANSSFQASYSVPVSQG